MGLLNKVKNFFFEFEEEVVEVDDEPKKGKKEEPVAKKIELPKAEKKDEEVEYTLDTEEIDLEKDNKFPMDFDDDDFKEEKIEMEEIEEIEETYETPSISRRSERRITTTTYDDRIEEVFEEVEEQTITREEPKYDFELEYGKEKERERLSEPHGLYEGKNRRSFLI